MQIGIVGLGTMGAGMDGERVILLMVPPEPRSMTRCASSPR